MTYELTNEDKLSIIDQHIRSVEYSLFGAGLDLIEANAVSTPDEPVISGIENRIEDLNSKKAALAVERANLA
jgi:methionine synthase I (cobalamin-dependent)